MNIDELRVELKNLSDSVFNINFRKSLQQLEDTASFSKIKKDVAKVLTILNKKK